MHFKDNRVTADHILIVEDSRSIAQELHRAIEEAFPVKVDIAVSYAEAAAYLDRGAEDLFVAILDLNLTDAPEGEIVDLFCARSVPSLVFTSDFSAGTRERVLAKGVIDYVVKDARAEENILEYLRRLYRNRGVRILVVEDSCSFRGCLRTLLERQMFQVVDVSDGKSALAALDEDAGIDLVVTDYLMSGMDGVQLTRAIRARFSREELPIIGISVYRDPMLTARFIKQGASDFLSKPFEVEEFYCRVNHNVELAEAFRQLSHANAVKNQFLGMVAHDLRSPISGIKGFSELLLDDVYGELSEEQREVIGFIHSANGQMNALVDDLLDISVIEAGQLRLDRKVGDLVEMANRVIRIRSLAAKSKSITVAPLEGTAPPFAFDARRVGQVLDNLLSNAIKFSPQGTTVRVAVEVEDGRVVVSVSDQGQGIPADEIGQLFESFRKTSVQPTAGEESTGLGLLIVRKIVEAHGGSVGVESEVGRGSTFRFSLPLN